VLLSFEVVVTVHFIINVKIIQHYTDRHVLNMCNQLTITDLMDLRGFNFMNWDLVDVEYICISTREDQNISVITQTLK
jgi:hypothetical protein